MSNYPRFSMAIRDFRAAARRMPSIPLRPRVGAEWCGLAALGLVLVVTARIDAGTFIFAGETNGVDVVAHPQGYVGIGGSLPVTVCIDPTSANAAAMDIPVRNMVHTWNQLVPTTPNLFFGTNNNIPPGEVDFESAALHELGHCIGLGHPNLATESGLPDPDRNYTQSTDGVNNVLEISPGGDGIRGSADDVRGDDVNLHWFRKSNNNPFTIAPTVDATTYGRPLTGLPGGHLFAANADRDVGAALGFPDTEAVMQQGQFTDEDQRALNHDDVATLALGMSGIDLTAGTADDYTLTLSYAGLTTGCDVVLDFDNSQTGFAACAVGGTFITGSHIRITSANIYFNTGFSWFFNPVLTAPTTTTVATTSTTSSTTMTGPTTSTTTTTLGSLVEHPQDALKVILKENTTTGKEKAVWVSKVPPIVLPSSDPTVVGATFRVKNPLTGETATTPLPALNWGTNPAGTLYKFVNTEAPGGPSMVKVSVVKAGAVFKVVAKDALISLDEASQGTIGADMTIGSDRYCSLCSVPLKDEPGKYIAKGCPAPVACLSPSGAFLELE